MQNEPTPVININTPQQLPQKPKEHNKALWTIAILMLLAVALSGWYWKVKKSSTVKKPVIYNKLPEGYKFIALPQGQYPEGFPKELVLSAGKFEVIRAEDTKVASGQNLKIVDVKSADRADSLTGLYRNTLTDAKHNWQLISSKTSGELTTLVFTKAGQQLTVIVAPKSFGSQMSLTYTPPK